MVHPLLTVVHPPPCRHVAAFEKHSEELAKAYVEQLTQEARLLS